MKINYLSAITLSLAITSYNYAEEQVATCFTTRSISRNAARDLAGWTNYINKDSSPKTVYGALSITPEYAHTFHGSRITKTLFGSNLIDTNCGQSLKISGSQVNNRGPQDLLADYFYLPTDFQSIVHFKPVIDNVIIDFGFYLGLDAWAKGVYFWLHAPFAHTRWDLNIQENIINAGVNNSAEGYYTPNEIPRNKLLDRFTNYVNGVAVPDIDNVIFEELKFAKMSTNRLVKSRLGELRTGFGWNFYAEPDFHVGFNGQIAAPTGLRPHGEFLFEPIVGNGHFWELGFGANGHYTFWRNEEETAQWSFYADINVTHLFRTRQSRVFDLKTGGTLSRYMLAMTMNSPAKNLQGQGTNNIPAAQFNNNFLPVANFTKLKVDVSIAIQADIVFMFNATVKDFSFDFGYNYWGRSSENIVLRAVESFAEKTFALKGDAHVFGFLPNSTTSVALSATENTATIHAGKNIPATGTTDPVVITAAAKNPNINFPQPARTNPAAPALPQNLLYAQNIANVPINFIKTSVPPLFITMNDLNINGPETRGSSSKLFGHMSYTWNDPIEWQPYLGFGGEVEWGHHSSRSCKPCKDNTPQGSTSQWGLWIKAGATFK